MVALLSEVSMRLVLISTLIPLSSVLAVSSLCVTTFGNESNRAEGTVLLLLAPESSISLDLLITTSKLKEEILGILRF